MKLCIAVAPLPDQRKTRAESLQRHGIMGYRQPDRPGFVPAGQIVEREGKPVVCQVVRCITMASDTLKPRLVTRTPNGLHGGVGGCRRVYSTPRRQSV